MRPYCRSASEVTVSIAPRLVMSHKQPYVVDQGPTPMSAVFYLKNDTLSAYQKEIEEKKCKRGKKK